MSSLQEKLEILLTQEHLALTEEEQAFLSNQDFTNLKCEFWAQAIHLLNQSAKHDFENYMSIVLSSFRDFDAIFQTDFYNQLKSFIPSRYMAYDGIDEVEKRYEYSAMLLRECFQHIEFRRLVDIMRDSIDLFTMRAQLT